MHTMPESVIYPNLYIEGIPARVDFLTEAEACAVTRQVLGLVVNSYSSQFEGAAGRLPNGTFASCYQTAEAYERFQNRVIPRVYARDGGYLGVRHPQNQRQFLGICKMLPGKYLDERFDGMTCLAEVLTDPLYQRQKIGSAMLLAYLGHDVPTRGVVLSAFNDSPVNEWYRSLGLEDGEPSETLKLGHGLSLPQHYMATPPTMRSRDVTNRLADVPALQEWHAIY